MHLAAEPNPVFRTEDGCRKVQAGKWKELVFGNVDLLRPGDSALRRSSNFLPLQGVL